VSPLLNTLYVTTPGAYVRLDNDTLRVDIEHETKLRVPLHHLASLVLFGHVMVTPAAMVALAEAGKTLVLLSSNGRFKARLEGPVSGNVLLRSAQHKLHQDDAFSRGLVRNLLAGKIQNTRQVLLRGAREAKAPEDQTALSEAAQSLSKTLRRLPAVDTIEALRGLEGDAARQYFAVFNHLIIPEQREAFYFHARSRRPPLDRINALLSFLYSLLMNDCRSAAEDSRGTGRGAAGSTRR